MKRITPFQTCNCRGRLRCLPLSDYPHFKHHAQFDINHNPWQTLNSLAVRITAWEESNFTSPLANRSPLHISPTNCPNEGFTTFFRHPIGAEMKQRTLHLCYVPAKHHVLWKAATPKHRHQYAGKNKCLFMKKRKLLPITSSCILMTLLNLSLSKF